MLLVKSNIFGTILYTQNMQETMFYLSNTYVGRAMAQAVSRRPLIAEARLRSRVSVCVICGGQSGTGKGFSPSTLVFPFQFHSTGATLLVNIKKTDYLSSSSQGCTISLKALVRP
jgi:hypothetical protein